MAKKRTRRTKKSPITEVKKAATGPAQPDDPSFRVYRWDQSLREALKQRREELSLTNREFIRSAVAKQLPQLVEQLSELGIAVEDQASRGPTRVPMEGATLKALRLASSWTDLPQNLLLQACLRSATRRNGVHRTK
jgi:hypothetical protein